MNIKKMRANAGLSQIDLAYRAGVSRFRLFLIEKGYQQPNPHEVEKLKVFFENLAKVQVVRK